MLGDIANLFKKDSSYTIKEDSFCFKKKLAEKTFLKKLNPIKETLEKIRIIFFLTSSVSLFFREYSFGGYIYSKIIASASTIYFLSTFFKKKKKKKKTKNSNELNFYIQLILFSKIFDLQKSCNMTSKIPCLATEFWTGVGFMILFTRFNFHKDRFSVLLRSLLLMIFSSFAFHCPSNPGWLCRLLTVIIHFFCSLIGGVVGSYALNYYSREFYSSIDSLKRSSTQLFINFTEIPEPILYVDPKNLRIIFYNLSAESFFNSYLREK